ncbi:MAG: metalloregulator ArsR/SmtB family transcription factor [Chloroflexota bacterium]
MKTVFDVIADPTRRKILDMLCEKPRPVGDLVDALDISQPGVSKHLRVLRDANLVRVQVDAQRRLYELRPEPLAEVDAWLSGYRQLWEGRFERLDNVLSTMQSNEDPKTDPANQHEDTNHEQN